MALYGDVEREKEIEALHRERLWEGNVKLSFFLKGGRGIRDISMATERHVGGRRASCGNLFEMSENLVVRFLCPMNGHFGFKSCFFLLFFRSDSWPLQGGSLYFII